MQKSVARSQLSLFGAKETNSLPEDSWFASCSPPKVTSTEH
jgi:hypothetical protein